jgi:tetratricopeptide (TPR) repeat protein
MESEELDKLWDFDNPKSSESKFRAVGTPEALTQVARALGLQGKFTEAHALLESVGKHPDITGVRAVLERGRLHRSSGNLSIAIDDFRAALARAVAMGADYYAVDAAHMLAICEQTEESHLEAIAMAAGSSDLRAGSWEASLLNNLGWTYFDERKLDQALDCFQRALFACRKLDNPRRERIASWCVARCQREMGRVEESLEVQYSLLKDNPDGFVFEELGECLNAIGRTTAAKPYFAEASRMFEDTDVDRAERLKRTGAGSFFADCGKEVVVLRRSYENLHEAREMLATAEGWGRWLGNVDPGFSDCVDFLLTIDGDANDVIRCKVLQLNEYRISVRWGLHSVLTMSFLQNQFELQHNGISDIASYAAAWHSALDLVDHLLSGEDKFTFLENYDALREEYVRLIAIQWRREIR